MLAQAINYAAAKGATEVWYGATSEDHADYPDCRPAFVEAIAALAMADVGVAVVAPLLEMTKAEVVVLADKFGVDLGKTWSCYAPHEGEPCGGCNSCLSRDAAMVGSG